MQYDQYPHKRGNLDTEIDTHKKKMSEAQREDGHLRAKKRGLEQILLSWSSEGINC